MQARAAQEWELNGKLRDIVLVALEALHARGEVRCRWVGCQTMAFCRTEFARGGEASCVFVCEWVCVI